MGNKTSQEDASKKIGWKTFFLGSAKQRRRSRKPARNSNDSPPPYHGMNDEQKIHEEQTRLDKAYQAMVGIVERIDNIGIGEIGSTILEISLLTSTSKISLPKDKWQPAKDICTFLRKNTRQDLIHNFLNWCLCDSVQEEYDDFVTQWLNSI